MSPTAGFRRRILAASRRFARCDRGAVSAIFAIASLTGLVLAGAAVDYGRKVGTEQRLQSALDAAMLAALQTPAGSRAATAANMLQADLAGSNIVPTWTQPPKLNADGSLTGVVTGAVPTSMLAIAGVTSLSATAASTVAFAKASTPSSVTFALTGAYGWYWKEVDLYIHQPGATSNTLVASYIYQPVDLGYQGGRGDGTVSALFLSGGVMTANAVTTPVSLGSNYDKAFLQMTVYSDGCGPGMAPTTPQSGSTTNYACVASGTTVQTGVNRWGQPVYTTYTKTATPVVYSTDDANTAHNLFVGNPGVMLPNRAVPSIFTLLPCGQTVQHAWEDTPWASPLPGSWSTQDIFFNVQVTGCAINANYQSTTPSIVR